jgi:acyl-CoA reductase-like NAD-dependent aldehyde dehydrogenase
MLLLVSMVVEPRAAEVTGSGHSGLKGLRSLRDGPRPQVPAGSVEDVDAAVAAAVAAKTDWAAKTPKDRSAVLLRIADIIEANRGLLETLGGANTGNPDAVAEDDISSAIDTFRFAAGAARAFAG